MALAPCSSPAFATLYYSEGGEEQQQQASHQYSRKGTEVCNSEIRLARIHVHTNIFNCYDV
jgi:hypothetical protein